MRYIVMAMIMVLTCLELSTAQAAEEYERESLRGLQEVEVLIEDIHPDAQADGLSVEDVRSAVELILRSSGIQVITRTESFKTPAASYLYVKISTFKSKFTYAVNVNVTLRQQVSLVHKPQHTMPAATWENSYIAIVGHSKFRKVISEAVEPLVKEFTYDFLTVNSR